MGMRGGGWVLRGNGREILGRNRGRRGGEDGGVGEEEGGWGDPTGVSSMMMIKRGVAGRSGDGQRKNEEKWIWIKEKEGVTYHKVPPWIALEPPQVLAHELYCPQVVGTMDSARNSWLFGLRGF